MKLTKHFPIILLVFCATNHQALLCADPQNAIIAPKKLDTIIPEERFTNHLHLLQPRDTVTATTATSQSPSSWAGMGLAAMRHVSKNYTEKGLVEYVTDSDNPDFFRFLANQVNNQTPLEQNIGQHTLEQHLVRGIERSTKAQTLIIDLLKKKDDRGIPTNEGAQLMLRAIDSCYLVLPDINLIIAKMYLKKYTDTYGEKALFNENILKELKFLPKLLNTPERAGQYPYSSPIQTTQPNQRTSSSSSLSASNSSPIFPSSQGSSSSPAQLSYSPPSPLPPNQQNPTNNTATQTSPSHSPVTSPGQTPPREQLPADMHE